MSSHPHRFTGRLLAATLFALAAAASSAAAQTPAAPSTPTASPAAPAAASPAEKPLSAEQRARYVGTYEVSNPSGPMSIRIYVENDKLMGAPGDDDPSVLLYQGGDTFRPQMAMDATIVFTVVDGKATKFTFNPPNGDPPAEAIRKQ